MAKQNPNVKVNADGSASITLLKPMNINGTNVTALRMREPTVDDQLVMEATEGTASLQEITLFANLCELAPGDLRRLTLRDYKSVQDGFRLFTD